MTFPTWDQMPAPVRQLARWITIVQIVGYSTALVMVWYTTRMRSSGIAERYRGGDPSEVTDAPMQFPKPFEEMLRITHTHLLSMVVIFALSGAALILCRRVTPRWKHFLITEPFVAILVSFAALWLTRYWDPRAAWLLMASSGMMALTFYTQSALVLRELGWRDPD